MRLVDLVYIKTVAEYNSISLAAEKLFLSQQRLSYLITKVENIIGVRIFERTNKGVFLTPIGEKVLDQIDILLPVYDDLLMIGHKEQVEIKNIRIDIHPVLNVGFIGSIVEIFKKNINDISIQIVEEVSPAVSLKKINRHETDLAFLIVPNWLWESSDFIQKYSNKTCIANVLKKDKPCLIIKKNSCLINHSPTLDDLYKLPLVDKKRGYLQQSLHEINPRMSLKVYMNTDNILTEMQLIKQDLAVGITLCLLANKLELEKEGLKILPFETFNVKIVLLISMEIADNTSIKNIAKLMQSVF